MNVRSSFLLLSLVLLISTLGGVAQTCANDECTNNDADAQAQQQAADPKRQISISNLSKYRADIHYDDGRFGKIVQTVPAKGESTQPIHTFVGHRFFVTMHGVREGLVDPTTDEQIFFTVGDDDDDDVNEYKFVIPKEATTSKTRCKDRYPVCQHEAARGECTNNPGWMIVNCCQSCEEKEGYGHLIDSEVRCTRERLNATKAAFDAGSLDDLFTKWATEDKFQQYEPSVISSPGKTHGAEHDGPWILTFDSFIDDEEIEALLKGAEYGGFERSTDQGKVVASSGEKEKVISTSRTSSNAWCRPECERLPGVRRVSKRIEEITGIPQGNYESFQILKYEVGEFYKRHHDSSGKNKNISGHRILTVFLYLNDVEEGGETAFTELGIAVKPKKGRALIWPSVLNDNPDSYDPRTFHEARAVVKGTKYAANHWIHQYDFRNANVWGCSGSFA
ncbi:hypothetical protein ACHAWT_010195 [Skeletonema menzelii]